MTKAVVLCILDGWGVAPPSEGNAIVNAKPHHYESLMKKYPHSLIGTSGQNVGLPDRQMGNSEVGHMTIGSGRIIEQDLVRINKLLSQKRFFDETKFEKLINDFRGNAFHLVGLLSDGGVHSHKNHLIEIVRYLDQKKIRTFLHLITDGRDTPPKSAINFLEELNVEIANLSGVDIATIGGRYYAMDRDSRYDRTNRAYDCIMKGNNKTFEHAVDVIKHSYDHDMTDEFIVPQSSKDYHGVSSKDFIVFTNFRADRMRQLVSAIVMPDFKYFDRYKIDISVATMTSYSERIDMYVSVLIPNIDLKNTLAEVLEANHMSQLRVAETEKYAHVSFFFNAGKEEEYQNEDRVLINSPKVQTYDTKPEMSAYKVTDTVIRNIASEKYNFIAVNYANADMVGHTGNYDAAVKAIQVVDECIGSLVRSVLEKDATLLITADHGNAECMFDVEHHLPCTSHTLNPVPFIVVNNSFTQNNVSLADGNLSDIAPTILTLLGIEVPKEMTGKNLINIKHEK